MKFVIVVQARMGSKRLPDKVVKDLLGKRVIDWILERAKRSKRAEEVVIATSEEAKDDVLEIVARESGVTCIRGSERDLISRLLKVVHATRAEAIIRVTGDSPLIDAEWIDRGIEEFKKHEGIMFLTNCNPPTLPEGYGFEIISASALESLDRKLKNMDEREAFVIYLANNPKEFPQHHIQRKENASQYRLTLDYPEDFTVIEHILKSWIEERNPYGGVEDAITYLKNHPEVAKINQHRIDRSKYPFSLGSEAIKKAI